MPDKNGKFKGISVPRNALWPPTKKPLKPYRPPADVGTKTSHMDCSKPNLSNKLIEHKVD